MILFEVFYYVRYGAQIAIWKRLWLSDAANCPNIRGQRDSSLFSLPTIF
ncbi:hypothetical protein RKLH11_3584 [Rhodobacteraceae bacterium KLH11]|nr:hypothetical protein RKLH11_3584 [Rhodobacteraceae bacterium KLH11]